MNGQQRQKNAGLYRPSFEHDNCGIGAIVNIKGQKSHDTVANALKIVEQLEHRAGKDAEGKTGDGVGILLQISHKFFSKVCKPFGIFLGSERDYGVGMFFFPQDELKRNQAKNIFEVIVEKEGMEFLGYARQVIQQMELLEDRYVAYKIGIIYDTPLSDMMIDRKVVNDNTDLCDWKFSDILYC